MDVITPLVMGTDVGTITIDCGVRRAALNRVGGATAATVAEGGVWDSGGWLKGRYFVAAVQNGLGSQLTRSRACGFKRKTSCCQHENTFSQVYIYRKIPQSQRLFSLSGSSAVRTL